MIEAVGRYSRVRGLSLVAGAVGLVSVAVLWAGAAAPPGATPSASGAIFDGADATRTRVHIALEPALDDAERPVDVRFPPGDALRAVVVLQGGRLLAFDRRTGQRTVLNVALEALAASGGEQGLLGLAFHPDFERNGRLYLNTTEFAGEGTVTRVTQFRTRPGKDWIAGPFKRERVVLEVPQPFANHNGGGLEFGPDGRLYVGLGDGGAGGDPHGNGQNPAARLGKMLRLDVDAPSQGEAPYTVFATGLRNPWRYAFDPAGRLVVGDVGQNAWEEIDLVPEGANLGWNVWEGRHCFAPAEDCPAGGFLGPIWEYSHAEGVSVTGGVVYTGAKVAALRGRYVFADYGTGRIWALDLPKQPGTRVSDVTALGRFGFSISCIARDPEGELWLCDHTAGRLWRVVAGNP